jgi:hypothetical protein
MKANGNGLTIRQERVAALIAAGRTINAACRECKVGVSTAHRWKVECPGFLQRIAELRAELTDRAIGRLADLMGGAAADQLQKLLAAKSEGLQLDAVRTVFELFISATNAAELKSRIERLEAGR